MLRAPVVKNDQRSASQNALHAYIHIHTRRVLQARARQRKQSIFAMHRSCIINSPFVCRREKTARAGFIKSATRRCCNLPRAPVGGALDIINYPGR
jgi:hypothetical protein